MMENNMIVIGASQGLGLCLTRSLLAAGQRVAAGVLVRNSQLEELQNRYLHSLLLFENDVTDESSLKQGAEQCARFLGRASSLCYVAGVLLPGDRELPLQNCRPEEMRATFAVNAFGPILAAKYFLPTLQPAGRFFVITSEGVGVKSPGSWVPLYGLSKTVATKACGIFNVSYPNADFFAVHPGRMNTEMGRTTAQIEPEESAEGIRKLMMGEVPLSRDEWYIDYLGKPMEA